MSNELKTQLRVLQRKDGLINLYLYHPLDTWSYYKATRDRNKPFINWIRKRFPEALNEFRKIPRTWNLELDYPEGMNDHFCVYGLTKQEYVMVKLSWAYKAEILHSKRRAGKPVKKGKFMGSGWYDKPTSLCVERFAREGFKQKPLKV